MNDKNKSMLAFPDAKSFKNIVAETLKMAEGKGASQAEAGLTVSQGLSVAVRMRSVETIEHQQDNGRECHDPDDVRGVEPEHGVQVAEQLIADGRVKWAWMGVFLADLVPEMAAQLRLPIREGVVIQDVLQDGPSHAAGIQPGDIILSMDGSDTATVSDLTRLLRREFNAGQEIEVELFRAGSRQTVRLVLGERPAR